MRSSAAASIPPHDGASPKLLDARATSPPVRRRDLSPAERRLLDLISAIDYGHIAHLVVQGGQPVLDPPPRTTRERLLGARPSSSPTPTNDDFALKRQVVELFEELHHVGDGVVERIDVRGGLPFRVTIVDPSGDREGRS